MVRALVKRIAFAVLASDPVLGVKLREIARSGALTILNLHRIDADGMSAYEPIAPSLFDELLGWLKSHFRIVTFADLAGLSPDGRPPLILSFDDGYKDFVEVAMPILARHGLRANQNVIPASIETGKPPMNVLVQDLIWQAPDTLLRELPLPIAASEIDPADRIGMGLKVSAAMKCRPISEQKAMMAQLEPEMSRLDSFRTTPMMTYEDVGEAAGAHEIGVHSWEHASMAAETDGYLADDAGKCAAWLKEFAPATTIYAFPNGSQRAGQADMVREAGFDHVLSVCEAFSHRSQWLHQRLTIYGRSGSELKFRAAGALSSARRHRLIPELKA